MAFTTTTTFSSSTVGAGAGQAGFIANKIDLSVIQKILSLKINSIKPSWLTALKSKYNNGTDTTNAIKVEMLESQR